MSQNPLVMQLADEIHSLGGRETAHLLPQLSVHSLRLFSLLRAAPHPVLIDLACDVADLPHWMRKLTALAVLKCFSSQRILDICLREIENPKREVRDAAALCLSSQAVPELSFKVFPTYEQNEGMAVFCGYFLQRAGYRPDVADFLQKSLNFESENRMESDYVRWYACRAAARAFDRPNSSYLSLFENLKELTAAEDEKTRKAAAEAAGYYIAESDSFNDLVSDLLYSVSYESAFSAAVHGALLTVCNAVLIHTGTHDFYKVARPRPIDEATIRLICDVYARLPVALDQQPGCYQNALVRAVLPTDIQVLELLDQPHPACLDAGISSAIYMQKYFYMDLSRLCVPLRALTFHQSKPISVLAERALRMGAAQIGPMSYGSMAEFAIGRMQSVSPDIRECAVRLVIWWFENMQPLQEDLLPLKEAIVSCMKNEAGGVLSQMPRKSAYECLEYLAKYIDCEDLEGDCLEELRQRTSSSTGPIRFLAQISERGLACCVINAFDAVCCDISDVCRQAVARACEDTISQDCIIEEVDALLQEEGYLAISGIARLCFALKHAGVPVDRIEDRLQGWRDICENEWFDELFAIHDAYAAAINGPTETVEPEGFFAECEFDEAPSASAAYLNSVYSKKSDEEVESSENISHLTKAILKRVFDEQTIADLLLSSDISPELKQKVCCGICGLGRLLPPKSHFDVKLTENVEKK